jgi:DNA-binding PadR family transcriptional regulator
MMFDPILHQPLRTQIVSLIAGNEEGVSFTQLLETAQTSNGNLSSHLRTLEDNGYIEVTKFFEGRRPKSIYRITQKGLDAFLAYIDALHGFLQSHPLKKE